MPLSSAKSIFLISFYLAFPPTKIPINLQANQTAKPLILKTNLDFVNKKRESFTIHNSKILRTQNVSFLSTLSEIRLLRILYGSSLRIILLLRGNSLSLCEVHFGALGRFKEISRFYRETWVFEFGEDATSGGGMNPFPDGVVSVLLQMHLVTMKNTI
ncbi:hypothetical protein CEXT_607921 [Caerostris extrusa]|uniref:Uncharacterized protein n=1 Tax=Caerostris extrusa TaxID=172846 RepID=A0AAV4QBB8_CAEEX|nr:hypothetical protein CEXT_607921 [Caerostris extrusa]